MPHDQVETSLREIYDKVPTTARGPGGHILTGPVYVEGAEPGDTLEIRIKRIELAIPYAYNGFRYGAGILTDDFPYIPRLFRGQPDESFRHQGPPPPGRGPGRGGPPGGERGNQRPPRSSR